MKKAFASPWAMVTLAVAGMTAGYVTYMQMNGSTAHASYSCPAKQHCDAESCGSDNSQCDKARCKSCPHCNSEATS